MAAGSFMFPKPRKGVKGTLTYVSQGLLKNRHQHDHFHLQGIMRLA